MQSVPVHIAVLAVARDGAPTKAVSEQATAAGHKVVARATVMDAQNAIRTQLALWIDDPNIDVIVVSGGTESSSASSALKPLISEVLPGFTDLFRYLAFQEIGAGAMHSNAEAARCNLTFVFVLPAAEGAVRAAMEKLILPQLDAKTTPKNLVNQMPRIQNMVAVSAVPTEIVKEKTAGGPGMNSRMPAAATPPRGRPLTANTIARRQETAVDDPPTRPIDVAKLEQQIALSEAGSSPTKRVDLSRLPKLPPGADDTLDDGEAAPPQPSNGRHARLGSEPIPPPAPASRQLQHTPTRGSPVVKPPPEPAASSPASPREIENAASRNAGVAIAKSSTSSAPNAGPPREIQHTPSRGLGVVAKAPAMPAPRHPPSVPPVPSTPSEPRIKKPTDPPPVPAMTARAKQSSGQVPAVPAQRVRQPSGQVPDVPSQRAKRPSAQVPDVPVRSKQASGPTPAVPSHRSKQPSGPDPSQPERQLVTIPADWSYPDSGPVAAVPAERSQSPNGSGATPPATPNRTKQPSGGSAAVAVPERAKQPSGPGTPPPTPRAKSPSTPPDVSSNGRTKRETDSASLGTATQSIPVVSPPPDMPLTMRATSQGIEVVSPSPALDPSAAVRLPPPRRRDDGDMASLVSTPLSRRTDDLPLLGDFSYPIKKTSKVGWILALLAMAALGFGAVVFIVPKVMSQGAASTSPPPAQPAVVATVPIDAQVTPEVTSDPVPVVVPEPTPTPIPTTTATTAPTTTPKTTGTTGTQTRPGTKQTPPKGTDPVKTAAGSGAGSQAGDEPEQDPPTAPPITDSDCDEVACVLHKYNRPCCEKYRPAESDIKPRAAGGLPTELDKAAVRSAIEKVKPAVVACGEKNSDKGTVKIAMKVNPEGSVDDASVASSPNEALGSCVASALRKAQFAKTVNGGTFTYPFVF